MKPDPWRHRSTQMRCRTCMWHVAKSDVVGRCRRRAPTMSGYPTVFSAEDWCGDHKLDEAAVEAPLDPRDAWRHCDLCEQDVPIGHHVCPGFPPKKTREREAAVEAPGPTEPSGLNAEGLSPR